MELVNQLKQASRLGEQYRKNERIDVHPSSYNDFAAYFERRYREDISSLAMLVGVPVYEKDYVPPGVAIMTTRDKVVYIKFTESEAGGE